MQRAKHPRTVYDFASAKLEKKNETAKKKGQKVGERLSENSQIRKRELSICNR